MGTPPATDLPRRMREGRTATAGTVCVITLSLTKAPAAAGKKKAAPGSVWP